MKLYLDPGHGGSDAGAQGKGINEKTLNLDIALRIRTILTQDYKGVRVRMSRSDDRTKSLRERTNEANGWGADFYLSIHCNAFNGAARGYEDFIYSSLSDRSDTAAHQRAIHKEVMKTNELPDRGLKKANFHVLRETAMPALLTENGFIDNPADARKMANPAWRQAVARGHVNGLAKAFKLKLAASNQALCKVIAGGFHSKENASTRVELLKSHGISAFITKTSIAGKPWYRVQAGAYSNRKNARTHLDTVRAAGINDAYITGRGQGV
ncbi:N-acetylmuramoyl-L-alanine amidase [Lentibacillus persicus]|uniref:N-acetylmuramoyl-L-alanine amidase n=1 Tax=Lentibacillus persicus TaxID=640948 RepID=A0A1I1S3Q8_9BACI|nr:N-acetylmuramoyl-L-alanine amidase [Lentibacillus persicus]